MQKLWNQTKNQELAAQVIEASSFFDRLRGLLGLEQLEEDKTMWIRRCNSVHTWFMKFPIDVVFVDKKLIVRAVIAELKPWRVTWPVWKAQSVFEMAKGSIGKHTIELGDQLYVGD